LIDKECFAVTPQAAGYKSQGFAIKKTAGTFSVPAVASN
jgi:hypothetical protein